MPITPRGHISLREATARVEQHNPPDAHPVKAARQRLLAAFVDGALQASLWLTDGRIIPISDPAAWRTDAGDVAMWSSKLTIPNAEASRERQDKVLIGKVLLEETRLAAWLRGESVHSSRHAIAPAETDGGTGGRPAHPMLDAFVREMVRTADQDGLPIERGALFRHMREWSEKTTDGNIGDATIRRWINRFDYRRA